MNILVIGAGVIGSIFAGKLRENGHHVTVLARGRRRREIQDYGLFLQDVASEKCTVTAVSVTERIEASSTFDLTIVAVRGDAVDGVFPYLRANRNTGTILFLSNLGSRCKQLVEEFGSDRVLIGFPGFGGSRQWQIVRFAPIPQQVTTVGVIQGQPSAHLRAVLEILKGAGIACKGSRHMDAWLATHTVLISALGAALYLSGSDCKRLSQDRRLLTTFVEGVREGLSAMQALGTRVSPLGIQALFVLLPRGFAIRYWRRFLQSDLAELVIGSHLRQAPSELRILATDVLAMLGECATESVALKKLFRAIDAYPIRVEASEGGSATEWSLNPTFGNGASGRAA